MKNKSKTVSVSVSEPVGGNTAADPLPQSPALPPPGPALPAPALARVATVACVIAPGINRSDLAITPDFLSDIATRGVVQPLIVRALPDGTDGTNGTDGPLYEIFAGARRWTAAAKAFIGEVPVAIYPAETPTAAMAELRLIENLQREDLSALDEAAQYREALEGATYGVGREAVIALGARVGKSASHIYSRLRLLKLPKALHQAWGKGVVSQSIVELIATLPDEADQLEALAKISEGDSEYDLDTGKHTLHCMSVREARGYIAREFQSDLQKALWNLDDAELYPEAGSCMACPFRGGHPEGAPGVEDSMACTRRSCYQKKRELFVKRKMSELEAAGKTVLSVKESEKLWKYGHLTHNGGYVEARQKPYLDKGGRTYEELLKAGKGASGKAGKEFAESNTVYVVNPDTGDAIKLFKRAGLDEALVAAGHTWAKPIDGNGSRSKAKPETAEAKAEREGKAALAKQVEGRVLEAVMKVVERPDLPDRKHALLWAFMFAQWLQLAGGPPDAFYKRRGIARSTTDVLAKLRPTSDLVLEVVRGHCLENALVDEYDGIDVLALRRLADLCGVDVKAIEGRSRAELKTGTRGAVRTPKAATGKVGKPVSGKKPAKAKGGKLKANK
jgi:ParB/RepB/Spo0J family partition protein